MRIAGLSLALRRWRTVPMVSLYRRANADATIIPHSRPEHCLEARMQTLDRIKDLAIKELSLDPAKIDPNAPLADLGVDSLTFIEFMFKIEDEFGVKVSDEDLRNIKCLADLERHVAASLQAAAKA